MRKWMFGTAVTVAVFLIVVGVVGAFLKNSEVSLLIIFGGAMLGITGFCYSESKCDACGKKNCVCDKPEKTPEKNHKC